MADKAWKAFERRVAKFFGTVRTPLSGKNSRHDTGSDSLHEDFYIEAKLRQAHAHHQTYAEASRQATKEGKIPILVTQQKFSPSWLITIDKDYLLTFCRKFLESKGFKVVRIKRK